MAMKVNAVPGLRIVGACSVWPQDILGSSAQLTNEQLYAKLLGPNWLQIANERGLDLLKPQQEYGVMTRGWTQGTSIGSVELGIAAAEKLLAETGCNAGDLDCIWVATSTPNHITSTIAGKIAKHLGVTAAAMDIRAGGAAGLNAIASAAMYHANGCQLSMIVAAEAGTKYLGQHDLANSLLFGDGASALIIASDASVGAAGLLGAVIGNASWQGKAFTVPGVLPPTPMSNFDEFFWQKPDAIYRAHLSKTWELVGQQLRAAFPSECAELSELLPYAVTRDQVRAAAESFQARCDISMRLLENHGCLGCASPVAAFAEYWNAHVKNKSDKEVRRIGSLAVAGGISWSGLLWQF
jgi:3-oxoacyl-[acyl-carrier-protein] synthase III